MEEMAKNQETENLEGKETEMAQLEQDLMGKVKPLSLREETRF